MSRQGQRGLLIVGLMRMIMVLIWRYAKWFGTSRNDHELDLQITGAHTYATYRTRLTNAILQQASAIGAGHKVRFVLEKGRLQSVVATELEEACGCNVALDTMANAVTHECEQRLGPDLIKIHSSVLSGSPTITVEKAKNIGG